MARPRKFDIEDALDAAMEPFWAHGYQATSMADLIEATGLQKGSLYKAFGDKRSLFLQVLARYMTQMYERQKTALEKGHTPMEAMEAWFDVVINYAVTKEGIARGCFAANSLVELAPHDQEICDELTKHHGRFVKLVSKQIQAGQEDGSFRQDIPAENLGQIVFTFLVGLISGVKGAVKPKDAKRLSRAMLHLMN